MIKDKVPLQELLTGLAEEAAELAQAALKYRRALFHTSPTPISEDEAYERLCEEIADTSLYVDLLDVNTEHVRKIKLAKARRWEERLNDT